MQRIWTTNNVEDRLRYAYWREALSNAFVPLEPVPLEPAGNTFNGAIHGLRLGTLRISTIAADGHEVSLTRGGISRQLGSPFFVNLLRHGSVNVTQYGERSVAKAGDIYVVDSAAPWSVSFSGPFEMFCIEIDESSLRPRLGSRGRLPSLVLSGAHNKVLSNYLGLLGGQGAQELEGLQDLVFEHCVALLARSGAGMQAMAPAARDSQMMQQRLLSFINNNLTDSTLSPDSVCGALSISRSYLFKLLAAGGHTFSSYVREGRLKGCRSALLRHPQRPVSQIAASWGFVDVSTFNRAYRAEFGETPRQTRLASA